MSSGGNKPLKQALQKRKTQQIERVIEERKGVASGTPGAPPAQPVDPRRTSQTVPTVGSQERVAPDPRRTSQTVAQAQPDSAKRQTIQAARVNPTIELSPGKVTVSGKTRLIIAAAAISLILVVVVSASLLSRTTPPPASPTFAPLPTFSANDIVGHLVTVGVRVASPQKVNAAQLKVLSAEEGIGFRVQANTERGQFMLLIYPTDEAANQGAFRATLNDKYKQWRVAKASNVVMLASPETSETLFSSMSSHFRQYVVAPYRTFLPTATP
jgi:hypothetical protein